MKKKTTERLSGEVALIEAELMLPMAPATTSAYIPTHVDVHLSVTQAAALRRVFDGLQARAVRLENGRFVQTGADAVRWILEQVAEQG
jgi:hypothetical protein